MRLRSEPQRSRCSSSSAGLRDARLDIGGDDLKAEGVPESAAIGAALAETLRRKLDGEISTREEQLRTALALAREAS